MKKEKQNVKNGNKTLNNTKQHDSKHLYSASVAKDSNTNNSKANNKLLNNPTRYNHGNLAHTSIFMDKKVYL